MIFKNLAISGVVEVQIEPIEDARGFFSRSFCEEEFFKFGIPGYFCQQSISFNLKRGTLRGMHFEVLPSLEAKLVRCTRGSIYDVVLDLREDSNTRLSWISLELTESNHKAVFIPQGCAHGFITLSDDSEVLYMMTTKYTPGFARGVRWDDPSFRIDWPIVPTMISERDATYPDFIG